MNKQHIEEVIDFLRQKNIEERRFDVEEINAEYQTQNINKPNLVISIVSILGGMLAAIFSLGFIILILFKSNSADSRLVIGVIGALAIILAIFITKQYKILLDTFGIAAYLFGYTLLFFSVINFNYSRIGANLYVPFLIMGIIAIVPFFFTQNYMISFISIILININMLYIIENSKKLDLVCVYSSIIAILLTFMMIKEAKIITINNMLSRFYNPALGALVLSFLFCLIISRFGFYDAAYHKRLFISNMSYVYSSLVNMVCVAYVVICYCEKLRIKSSLNRVFIIIATLVVLLPTVSCPVVSGSILMILLGFLVARKVIFGLSIATFIYSMSLYYYDLNFSLLVKSGFLIASGVLFIAFYLLIHNKLGKYEKV